MLTFEQFADAVLNAMEEGYENISFKVDEIVKPGEKYTGLIVTERSDSPAVSISINLDAEYEKYQEDGDLDRAVLSVEETMKEGQERLPKINAFVLGDYDKAKKTLVIELIPIAGNEEVLETMPHEVIGDIAVIYRFQLSTSGDCISTTAVTNRMLDKYGITAEQLRNDAMTYAPANRPARFVSIVEMLNELSEGLFPEDRESPLYVASDTTNVRGAGVIMYPGFLETVSEKLGDMYIIPSSIHEVLIMKDDGIITDEDLNEMITSINNTEVEPAERLSYQAYHYDAKEKKLETAADFTLRTKNTIMAS